MEIWGVDVFFKGSKAVTKIKPCGDLKSYSLQYLCFSHHGDMKLSMVLGFLI